MGSRSGRYKVNGWIKLHKSIMDNWVWSDAVALRAWLDLLMSVNYVKKKILFDGELISIEKGQIMTSIRKLADKWDCTPRKAGKLLQCFVDDQMIELKKTKRGTLLTVVNYSIYQDERNTADYTASTTESITADHTASIQHKNIKNNKEIKNIYVDSVEEIFRYLNDKTGKNYTGRSKAQRDHIIARLKEGYTVEEFKKVIDNKTAAWKGDPKMDQYLRPETLFSTKFETYLNDTGAPAPKKPGMFNSFPQRDHDDDYFANLERKKLIGG